MKIRPEAHIKIPGYRNPQNRNSLTLLKSLKHWLEYLGLRNYLCWVYQIPYDLRILWLVMHIYRAWILENLVYSRQMLY